MKIENFVITILILALLVINGCPNPEIVKNPKLEVKLIQMLPTGTSIIVQGTADLDLSNVNYTRFMTTEGINTIKENSQFISRFHLDFSKGTESWSNVKLRIKADKNRISNLGVANKGFIYLNATEESIDNSIFNVYIYEYGSLKAGDENNIVFVANTKSLNADLDATTPIYVTLENEGGPIANERVLVTIKK